MILSRWRKEDIQSECNRHLGNQEDKRQWGNQEDKRQLENVAERETTHAATKKGVEVDLGGGGASKYMYL